jgi:hypothetical protein
VAVSDVHIMFALFVWLISHQPAVLFSQNKPATSNQPALLLSHNKSEPAISHQPNEQAVVANQISSLRSKRNPKSEVAHFPKWSIRETALWQKTQCILEV